MRVWYRNCSNGWSIIKATFQRLTTVPIFNREILECFLCWRKVMWKLATCRILKGGTSLKLTLAVTKIFHFPLRIIADWKQKSTISKVFHGPRTMSQNGPWRKTGFQFQRYLAFNPWIWMLAIPKFEYLLKQIPIPGDHLSFTKTNTIWSY